MNRVVRSTSVPMAEYLTNQILNALNAPVDAACAELDAAQADAAALPARVRLGDLAPDMMRLDAETKQITHAIRMAAYPAVSSRPERTRRSRQGGPSTGKPG